MKNYKGQIDETWTEVDLTQFKKENPKYADSINLPTDYDQKISLDQITFKDSILYLLAKAMVKDQGYYTCTIDGLKTLIVN